MSFEELGHMLRQTRERRGLSVEDVADRLKLMPRIVRAMEQADVGELPQTAYARGFVKAYGNLLELEPEQLQAGMDDAWPEDSYLSHASYEPAETRKGGGKGRLATLISLMLIAAAAGGFWLARDLELYQPSAILPRAEPAPPAAPLKAEPAMSVKDEFVSPSAQAQDIPPPGADPAAAVTPAVPDQPVSPAVSADSRRTESDSRRTEYVPGTEPQAAQAAQSPAAPAAVAAPAAAPQDSRHHLIIVALAECWVHSNADNTDTRQFSLRKGDTFALTFNKSLVLKLGNAGGVRLRLDGRELDPPGATGQVRTLTFPANR